MQGEGIFASLSEVAGGWVLRLPALSQRHALLAQSGVEILRTLDAGGIAEVDDEQTGVRRLKRACEPRDRVLR